MDHEPTDLEGAEVERQEIEEKRKKQQELEALDFRWVLSDARGRRFVWRLMEEAKVFHDCSSHDAQEMARFLGERRQGLRLVNELLRIAPEHWMTMIKERQK